MAQLILIKHAMPTIIDDLPAKAWQLSEAGRASCFPLAEQLRPYIPDVMLTSTEPKAEETGRIVAQQLGIPVKTVKKLHEHDREGVPFYPDKAVFEGKVRAFFAHPDTLVFGNETANAAYTRYEQALTTQIAAHPNQTIAVAAHGTVNTLFTARKTKAEAFPGEFTLWKRLKLPSYIVLSLPEFELIEIVDSVPAN